MSDIKWHNVTDNDAFELMYQAKYSHKDLLVDTDVSMRIINATYVDLENFMSMEVNEKIIKFAVIGDSKYKFNW
jgi:hypothetical protein